MGFRANEGMSPKVIAQVSAYVPSEVITALIIAAGEISAGCIGCIKSEIFSSDAGHNISAKHLGESSPVHRIEVIKDWAIGLNEAEIAGASSVHRATRPPGNIAAKADVVL
jgi:hypothetical protein